MFIFLLLVAGFSVAGGVEIQLGENVFLANITRSSPATLSLELTQPDLDLAVRVFVSSADASVVHPLLVAVSQDRGIHSWTLPHVEGGFEFSSVERTLCPLQNGNSRLLTVHVTTSSPSALSLSFNTTLVDNYHLQLGVPVTFTASPSSPAFFVFDFPSDRARVKVRFSSEGPSSTICSIASVQRTYCPVVELLDNPDHRGTFQTMRSKATIDAKGSNASSRLYAVMSVFPTDNCDYSSAVQFTDSFATMTTADNYNPTPANVSTRMKEVTVTVETALGDDKYAVAMVVASVVYLSFYIIALGWIIVFDWWRYEEHSLFKLLRRQQEQVVDQGDDLPDGGGSPVPAAEEHDFGVKSFFSRSPVTADSAFQGRRLVKRPSLLNVLLGNHLDDAVTEVSSGSASSLNHTPPQLLRQNSQPLTLVRRVRSESDPPLRGAHSLDDHAGGYDQPDTGQSCDTKGASHNPIEERRQSSLCKKDSYRRAVETGPTLSVIAEEGGRELKFDCHPLPVNMLLCELPDFDDSSKAQKQYNGFAWHLLTVTIFYAIPSVQLVSTYQQLVNLSGNEDICYFNSLCSHPWEVTQTFTITALNNIFSNIGYFVLGFLFLLLAYRRRTIYRSFERFNVTREREERVGVPQHFGIYYAIGLALMAEAFMSSVYHICPSNTNYQFDTTFMFVLCTLGLYQILVARSPDLRASLHGILLLLAVIILVVVVGVVYSSSVVFYVLFSVVYLVSSLFISLQFYYRWQLLASFTNWKAFFTSLCRKPIRPKQIPKFVMLLVLNAVNIGFAVFAVAVRPADFGSYFLATLVSNFVLALFYYVLTKCVYRELPSGRPVLYFALSVLCWACGVYFYLSAVTDWLLPPALSRDGNERCIVLGFFDAHDCWHFVSAFALFFSFLMLMSLDDRQEARGRDTLRTF